MKVLMVNKFLFPKGGAETYMLRLGECLTDLGHQVAYFGMDDPKRTVGNRWDLYTMPMDFHDCNMLQKAGYLTKIIYSREARQKMYRLLTLFQPDVVHLNNFNFQLTPSVLLAAEQYRRKENPNLRIVYTAHDFQLICPNHLLFDPAERQICEKCLDGDLGHCLKKKCIHGSRARSLMGTAENLYWNRRNVYRILDAILCPSCFMKQKLDGNPVLAERTVFVRNFVAQPKKAADAEKENYVLYFGRYSEEKGIRTLVNVCKALPEIPFVFAGGGPLEHLLKDVPNVRNMGFLKADALQETIQRARFSLCLSQCHDNCPFSVMESIMAGTPVLGSPNGGIPELIREGETGWICPAEAKTLTEEIKRIWSSQKPENYREACLNTRFGDLTEYVEKLLEIYRGGMPSD